MTRFEHRRSTVREGVRVLVGTGATVMGLVAFQVFVFPSVWEETPRFVVAFWAIEGIVTFVALLYGILNIIQGQEFVCRIDGSWIECASPAGACGQTFKLRIADIAKVEREEWSESHRWYLWDKAGHRYWLTSNYGNPADKIIELIQKTNTGVTEVRT